MDKYSFGKCSICGKYMALKNGVCPDCKDYDISEFLKELFNKEKLW